MAGTPTSQYTVVTLYRPAISQREGGYPEAVMKLTICLSHIVKPG